MTIAHSTPTELQASPAKVELVDKATHAANVQERERNIERLLAGLRESNKALTAEVHKLRADAASDFEEHRELFTATTDALEGELSAWRAIEKSPEQIKALLANGERVAELERMAGTWGFAKERDFLEARVNHLADVNKLLGDERDRHYAMIEKADADAVELRAALTASESARDDLRSKLAELEKRAIDAETERDELDAKLDDIESKAPDGREAEELRHGLEALMREGVEAYEELGGMPGTYVPTGKLQRLLDDVDARDSLAYLEHVEADLRSKLAQAEGERDVEMASLYEWRHWAAARLSECDVAIDSDWSDDEVRTELLKAVSAKPADGGCEGAGEDLLAEWSHKNAVGNVTTFADIKRWFTYGEHLEAYVNRLRERLAWYQKSDDRWRAISYEADVKGMAAEKERDAAKSELARVREDLGKVRAMYLCANAATERVRDVAGQAVKSLETIRRGMSPNEDGTRFALAQIEDALRDDLLTPVPGQVEKAAAECKRCAFARASIRQVNKYLDCPAESPSTTDCGGGEGRGL